MSDALRPVCTADDDKPVRRALNRLIQRCGCDITALVIGRECLDGHEDNQTGLINIDVSMSGQTSPDCTSCYERLGERFSRYFVLRMPIDNMRPMQDRTVPLFLSASPSAMLTCWARSHQRSWRMF